MKSRRKKIQTFAQFRRDLGYIYKDRLTLLGGIAQPSSKLEDIIPATYKLIQQIIKERNALSYYEVGIAKADVARAKLNFPPNALIQYMLDGYLARAIGNDNWSNLQKTLDAVRKLTD